MNPGLENLVPARHIRAVLLAACLLALALPGERRMLPFFAAVSATGFMNLLLHDEFLRPQLSAWLSHDALNYLELANCVANLVILVTWTVWLVRGRNVNSAAANQSPPPAAG